MEEDKLKGYKEVGHTVDESPEVLSGISKRGEVVTVNVNESTTKTGDKANVTEELLHVYTSRGMDVTVEDGKYFVTFEDGTKEELSETTSKRLAENGVGNNQYMAVTAQRESTDYEKQVAKNKRKILPKLLPLILAGLMILPIAKGCNDNKNYTGDQITSDTYASDTYAPDTDPIDDSYGNLSQEEVINIIIKESGISYDQISVFLTPATIVRTAQDAYEAIDFDMEAYLGSDLCKYATIQQGVVNPGADFVMRVNAFKDKYGNVTEFDEETYKQMMKEAGPLLEEQGVWIDTAIGLVVEHARTTQATIDVGKRVEDYTEEIKVTNGQVSELEAAKGALNRFYDRLKSVDTKIEGIQNGTLDYLVTKEGGVIILDANQTIVMRTGNTTGGVSNDTPVTPEDTNSIGFSK